MILRPTDDDAYKIILNNILLNNDTFASNVAQKIKTLADQDPSKMDPITKGLFVNCELAYEGEVMDPQLIEDYFNSIYDAMTKHYQDVYSDVEKEIKRRVDSEVAKKMEEMVNEKSGKLLEQLEEITSRVRDIHHTYDFVSYESE